MTILDHAFKLAAKGKPVFPCAPGEKRPLTPRGFKDASMDAEQIRAWWAQWPEANLAMPTGAVSGLVVLDVDQDAATGADGEQSLAALVAEHGPLPATLEARTPRGGRHLYFLHPGERVPCSTATLGAHLDVRADGGYSLLPPSRTGAGEYAWINRHAPAPMPDWLRVMVVKKEVDAVIHHPAVPRPTDGTLPPSVEQLLATGAEEGRRNAQAFRLACQLRDAGLPEAEAETRVLEFAGRCSPALATREALATLRSAYAQPAREPARGTNGARRGLRAEYLPGVAEDAAPLPEPMAWPEPMHEAAFHGLAGELIRTIEPHTEADPAALLVMFLSAFGSMTGPAPHFLAEARRHPARVWPVLVGETAKGRKGSAWSSLRHVLAQVDEGWCAGRVESGLSSGEGLVWAVRDPITRTKRGKDGAEEIITEDAGIADKRLFAIEEEFSAVLKVSGREGNTISDLLRRAWDDGNLRTLTKNNPARATGAHVSVAGHITRAELSRLLKETDTLNGFGNRFLWVAVRRSKLLPDGGALHRAALGELVFRLRQALDQARRTGEVNRTAAAREFWHRLYPALTGDRPGLLGAITNRAEAQVMRLALTYALLDGAARIDVAHLRAALAVWDYCERSARFIFGDSLGDRLADRIGDELRAAGPAGLTQTQLRDLFQRNEPAGRIAEALALLQRHGLAVAAPAPPTERGGRPAKIWKHADDRNDINDQTGGAKGVLSYKSFLSWGVSVEKYPPRPEEPRQLEAEPAQPAEEEVYV